METAEGARHPFRLVADLFSGEPLSPAEHREARLLLAVLGFAQMSGMAGGRGADRAPVEAALLRVAAWMPRFFRLRSPLAPGLTFFGGIADPAAYGLGSHGFACASASGRGRSVQQAFKSCVGEGAEYLSQLEWGDEKAAHLGHDEALAGLSGGTRAAIDARLGTSGVGVRPEGEFLWARCIATGMQAAMPVELCLRRRIPVMGRYPSGLGSGCAAAESTAVAAVAALLELIERDAAALWWLGGRQGCAVDDRQLWPGGIEARLEAIRQDAGGDRTTWLLDITTDLGVPSVAAMSCRAAAGDDLACGLAARPTLAEAADAALLELCQMELANELVALRVAQAGLDGLADVDARRYRRMCRAWKGNVLLTPSRGPRDTTDFAPAAPEEALGQLAGRLSSHGIQCFAIDLTRAALGVPVVRVLAPELQPLPASVQASRLRDAAAATGGGGRHTGDLDLF